MKNYDKTVISQHRSILDKLIGAQNSGKAPAGQPTIPDLATEVNCALTILTIILRSMSLFKVLSPYDDGIQGNPVGLLQV